jgi:5-methyltetrahydropteroyltriglutamate--homocysteine methyltransferase
MQIKTSHERVLTSHVGSLPHPDDLWAMMQARASGGAVDEATYVRRLSEAVQHCVRRQANRGLDVITDGEMGKPKFAALAEGARRASAQLWAGGKGH